ncbi:hypothetical protein CFIO01_02486 [Colletotrichum fioriniae PJ7]|uniref:Uncharacterized protein n=1 Tax=Colletotrichum fioriniae PJ7 TaxID=1445577 RepID=A0A010R0D2_9PEZI|nr:hypothetical protein CFIO01_02486 [Colletotrichum fioriniae PJ7]
MSYDYCVFIKNFSGSQHDYELSYTDGTTKTTKTIAVSNGDQGDEVLELEATMVPFEVKVLPGGPHIDFTLAVNGAGMSANVSHEKDNTLSILIVNP